MLVVIVVLRIVEKFILILIGDVNDHLVDASILRTLFSVSVYRCDKFRQCVFGLVGFNLTSTCGSVTTTAITQHQFAHMGGITAIKD